MKKRVALHFKQGVVFRDCAHTHKKKVEYARDREWIVVYPGWWNFAPWCYRQNIMMFHFLKRSTELRLPWDAGTMESTRNFLCWHRTRVVMVVVGGGRCGGGAVIMWVWIHAAGGGNWSHKQGGVAREITLPNGKLFLPQLSVQPLLNYGPRERVLCVMWKTKAWSPSWLLLTGGGA